MRSTMKYHDIYIKRGFVRDKESMRSTKRDQEIYVESLRSTWGKQEFYIYINRSLDRHEKRLRSKWREHKI